MNLKNQRQVGHYKIVSSLAGEMGEVYSAERIELAHQIAVISEVDAVRKVGRTRMLIKKTSWLLILSLATIFVQGQALRPLTSGQSVEREIAGSESHTYQISLTAGQFVRFRLEQQALGSSLIMTAPDGKQIVEMDLTGIGEQESLSLEAVTPGSYRLTVRGEGG
jgi:hypothetical protein